MPVITVPGGDSTLSLAFATNASGSLATYLLGSVYAAAASATLVVYPQPSVAGAVNEYVIAPTVTGAVTVPAGYDVVVDAAPGVASISGNGAANVLLVAGGNADFIYTTNGGSGTIIAGGGSDTVNGDPGYTQSGDATFTDFLPGYTYTTAPPGVIIITGFGTTTEGTGSGDNLITDAGMGSNVVVVDAGATTVHAVSAGGLFYDLAGTLTFINDIGGTYTTYGPPTLQPEYVVVNTGAGTVVGTATAGPATIYGGNQYVAYFQGADTAGVTFVNGAANSSVVGGAAGDILAYDAAGGTLNLFGTSSSAFNYLVGGSGAETLNAAFAAGSAVLIGGSGSMTAYLSVLSSNAYFAGSGAATIVGSSDTALPDLYAFVSGASGGSDEILNWNPNSGLVFLGYGTAGDAAIAAAIAAAPTASAVSITLPDNTSITLVAASGATVDLGTSRNFLG